MFTAVPAAPGLFGDAMPTSSDEITIGASQVVTLADRALNDAAFEGTVEDVLAALAAGADINATDENNETALHVALRFRNEHQVARTLIEKGADLSLLDADQRTVLNRIAHLGNRDLLRLVLKRDLSVNATSGKRRYFQTALFAASAKGHADIVADLIRSGADCNHRDLVKQIALHCADRAEIVDLLVDAGADMTAIDEWDSNIAGKTPLVCAAEGGRAEVARRLIARGSPLGGALHAAIRFMTPDPDLIEALCQAGVDLNVLDRDRGEPPLGACAAKDAIGPAQCLIRYGATIDTPDREGRTPLLIAAWHDHGAMVALLLEAGADTTARYDKDDGFEDLANRRPSVRAAYDSWRARTAMRTAARGHIRAHK
jgi:ankyrin repeat protein